MIDVHCHILPKIDDGSKSVEMSVEMMKQSYAQGIDTMIATPHFYISHTDVEHFLKKRQNAYETLCENTKDMADMPKLNLGAEVLFFNGISAFEDLDKLTINNGEYLLLEMPFSKWNDKIIREVETLIYDRKFKIIIAHIERFIDFQKGTDYINELISLGPLVQMNGEYINGFFTKSKALTMIKEGTVQLLGSDCHNLDKRCPNLGKAFNTIEKKLGQDFVDKINKIGYDIVDSGLSI